MGDFTQRLLCLISKSNNCQYLLSEGTEKQNCTYRNEEIFEIDIIFENKIEKNKFSY